MDGDGNQALISFLDRLHAAGDPDALRGVFQDAVSAFGFKYFAYHIVRISGVGNRLPYLISNYPDEWVSHYFAEGYQHADPVLDELPNRKVPFRWSEVTPPETLTAKQKRLFDEATDAGVRDGMTIPLHGRTNFATVSLVPGGTAAEVAQNYRVYGNLIHLMALYYHAHAASILLDRALSTPRQKSLLSPREREVLQWTAQGKTSWDISTILGISEKGVEFHLDSVKRKLQVVNRTHAVVKAVMLGLIHID